MARNLGCSFIQSKISEIQKIIVTGNVSDEERAKLQSITYWTKINEPPKENERVSPDLVFYSCLCPFCKASERLQARGVRVEFHLNPTKDYKEITFSYERRVCFGCCPIETIAFDEKGKTVSFLDKTVKLGFVDKAGTKVRFCEDHQGDVKKVIPFVNGHGEFTDFGKLNNYLKRIEGCYKIFFESTEQVSAILQLNIANKEDPKNFASLAERLSVIDLRFRGWETLSFFEDLYELIAKINNNEEFKAFLDSLLKQDFFVEFFATYIKYKANAKKEEEVVVNVETVEDTANSKKEEEVVVNVETVEKIFRENYEKRKETEDWIQWIKEYFVYAMYELYAELMAIDFFNNVENLFNECYEKLDVCLKLNATDPAAALQ